MTFKAGDKVARRGAPNELFGEVEAIGKWWGEDAVHVKAKNGGGTAVFRMNGDTFAGTIPEWGIVHYPPAPPKSKRKALILTPKGHILTGEEIVVVEGDVQVKSENSCISALIGDEVYKLVGRVVRELVTEEDVPIEVGYKYSASGGYETEVLAIHDDYAFIQCSRDGVKGGCTTIRLANIPKQKRPCNKYINKLVKE